MESALSSVSACGCCGWFCCLAIVAWVFWPGRKRRLERHGRIPLDEDR